MIAVHDLARSVTASRSLLISHATGFHAHCYDPLVAELGDDFDVVGLDHRGHGYTEIPASSDIAWQRYGDDAGTIARREWDVDAGGVFGFGHSMGASALLLAARDHPQLFRQLIVFEPITPSGFPVEVDHLTSGTHPMVVSARRRRDRFESVEAAIENFASKPPLSALHPGSLRGYVEYGFRPDGDGITLRCRPEMEARCFANGSTNGVWEALPDVQTPTVVLGGRVEPSEPSSWAEAIAERLPNGRYVPLPDQTHFGPMSHPAEVADLIRSLTA